MKLTNTTYRASCKLMLFGEYLVLRGSDSMAFPLKFGQDLEVHPSSETSWKSYSPEGCWFEATFDENLNLLTTNNQEAGEILSKLFQFIQAKKPELNVKATFKATADFNLSWGLGSSSTLISLLAQWSQCNPYELLENSFGGSGYDIACATATHPIIYSVEERLKQEIELSPNVTNQFLFVYLGEKQNSRNEIKRFTKSEVTKEDIEAINQIIQKAADCIQIESFEALIDESERLLSPIIGKERLKEHIFADYNYSIKSLGAWGGDFFLATYRDLETAKNYFNSKGFNTMFTYNELILK